MEKFYFEYNTKYKDELMEELMTVDHDDMHNRISSILNFELKCHDVFEIILQYLNMRSTRNIRKSKLIILVVQQELHFIRLFSECLKNFNCYSIYTTYNYKSVFIIILHMITCNFSRQ